MWMCRVDSVHVLVRVFGVSGVDVTVKVVARRYVDGCCSVERRLNVD